MTCHFLELSCSSGDKDYIGLGAANTALKETFQILASFNFEIQMDFFSNLEIYLWFSFIYLRFRCY